MNNEMAQLAALRSKIGVEASGFEVQITDEPRLNLEQPQEDEGSHPPDYHLQFAMLFQKLDNMERKIRELDEKGERFQGTWHYLKFQSV
jgi:hypothetical protein